MVKKLFKHEILSYMRVMPILYIVLLGVAAMSRAIQLLENDSVGYGILNASAITAFGITCLVGTVLTFIFSIRRFYQHLFSSEGYLSFTLPVTSSQHIFVKATVATLFDIAYLVVVFASVCIITLGDVLWEVGDAARYLLIKLSEYSDGNLIWYIIECIPLFLVSTFCTHLMYYAFIAIGQLSNKNRVLVSIGVYFGHYMLTQVISTVGMIIVTATVPFWEPLVTYIEEHFLTFVHVFLCGATLLTALMAFVYYLVSHIIIKKRLNLE